MKAWKSFYKKVSDPRFAQAAHGWFTIVWFIAAFPICILLANSLPFVVFISVYAVVTGHWAAWQACRTEVAQIAADQKLQEDHARLKAIDPDHPKQAVNKDEIAQRHLPPGKQEIEEHQAEHQQL